MKRDWDYFFLVKQDLGFFIYSWFGIAHIWFLRERERILGIIRDAWTVSIFLRECILQSGMLFIQYKDKANWLIKCLTDYDTENGP